MLNLHHVFPAAVSVDVKAGKKKDSASVKVDGRSHLPMAHTETYSDGKHRCQGLDSLRNSGAALAMHRVTNALI